LLFIHSQQLLSSEAVIYEHLCQKQLFFRHTSSESLGLAPLSLRFLSRLAEKFLALPERSLHYWFLKVTDHFEGYLWSRRGGALAKSLDP
jgi:hypothetical protein